MRAAEKYLTSNHANTGTISQNIIWTLRFMTADHRDTTRHELGEIISNRAQDPEFRGFEPGVVFGHGHAPGAYVASNIDFPLGHGIGGTIGGIPVNRYFRPGIKPTHIIGARSHNFNAGVGKTHGTSSLARGTQYFEI